MHVLLIPTDAVSLQRTPDESLAKALSMLHACICSVSVLLARALVFALQKMNTAPQSFDSVRAARMGGYGFCFYGPYQNFWYGLLDKFFPTKSLSHFGTKVCTQPF